MFFFEDTNGGCDPEGASDEDRLAVSNSEGFASVSQAKKSCVSSLSENFGVALQRRSKDGPVNGLSYKSAFDRAEGQAVGGHRETDGVGVSAEAREESLRQCRSAHGPR